MARIPNDDSVGTHNWSSPRMVARVDENALAAPGRAQARMGEAIAGLGKSLGGALSAVGSEDKEAEAYATHTKFLDFDKQQNDAYVEQERGISTDGTGFREGITNGYDTGAREFFKNVPEHLKPKYDNMLRQRGIDYERRARDREYQQRDTYHVNDVTTRLDKEKAALEQNPDNIRDVIGRGVSLIDASPLPLDRKEKARKDFVTGVERRHIELRLQRGDDPDEVLRDIESRPSSMRPQLDENGNPVRQDAPSAPAAPASFRIIEDAAPSVDERRRIAQQGGITVNLDTNWAERGKPTTPMVVIPNDHTPEQRRAAEQYAAAISDVYHEQFGVRMAPKVITKAQNVRPGYPNGAGRPFTIHTEPFSVNDDRAVDFFTSDQGRRMHADILRRTFGALPGVAFSIPHDPTGPDRDHGAHGPRGNEVELARKLLADLKGGGGGGPVDNRYAGPPTNLNITPDLVDKDAKAVSQAVAGKMPGMVHAVTDQTTRTFDNRGFGNKTTGFLTVNGNTYRFVNGGSGRGSIPLGTYSINRFTSGSQRAQEGRQFLKDAFELADARGDAPGTKGTDRTGLLIHDGNNGVTAGCVGIVGDFSAFKRDLMAEQAKNGGKLTLNLTPRPTKADETKVASLPGRMNLGAGNLAANQLAESATPTPQERELLESFSAPTSSLDTGEDARMRVVDPPKTGDDGIVRNGVVDRMNNEGQGLYQQRGAQPASLPLGVGRGELVGEPALVRGPGAPSLAEEPNLVRGPGAPQLQGEPQLVRGPAVMVGDQPVATVNGKNQIATILDGVADDQPLSALPDDVRDDVMRMLPKDALKEQTMPNGEKVAAVDVVTVGEIKKMFADEARAAQGAEPPAQPQRAVSGPTYSDKPVYRYLSEEDRRLMASKAQGAQRNKYLTSGKAEVDYIRRHGEESLDDQGRSLIERAQRVLLPNQLAKLRQEIETAKWQYRMVNPIADLPDSQLQQHLDRMEPMPADATNLETYQAKSEAYSAAMKMASKVQEKRQKDAAASVTGWREADGSRVAPAPEVRRAMEAIERSKQALKSVGTDPSGKPSIITEEMETLTPSQAWEMLIDARLEAQERIFGDKADIRIRSITKGEAERLLRFTSTDTLTSSERLEMLRMAAERADRVYGKHARRVFDDAVRMVVRGNEAADDAAGIAQKYIRKEPITARDVHRYQLMAPMSGAEAFARGQLPRTLTQGMGGMSGFRPAQSIPGQFGDAGRPAMMNPAVNPVGAVNPSAPVRMMQPGVQPELPPQPAVRPNSRSQPAQNVESIQDSLMKFFGAR